MPLDVYIQRGLETTQPAAIKVNRASCGWPREAWRQTYPFGLAYRRDRQRYNPVATSRQEQELATTKAEFYDTNKDLLKFEKIVKQAATEVQPTKADGTQKSKAEIFKEVATLTRTTLKEFGIDLKAANLGSERKESIVPKANKLSDSGRSGGDQSVCDCL